MFNVMFGEPFSPKNVGRVFYFHTKINVEFIQINYRYEYFTQVLGFNL